MTEFQTILEEADEIAGKTRSQDYAHPADNFRTIAGIWSAILGRPVSPQQVGLCMIGVKIARERHKHKRDNLVDIAGYARTLEMVEETLQREAEEREALKKIQESGQPGPSDVGPLLP